MLGQASFYTIHPVYQAAGRSCLSWTFPPTAHSSTPLFQDVISSRSVLLVRFRSVGRSSHSCVGISLRAWSGLRVMPVIFERVLGHQVYGASSASKAW